MKISNKISLVILTTGISVLLILSLAVYTINRAMVVKSNLKHSEIQAMEASNHINRFLSEKIKIVMMMATSRVIFEALETSNLSYSHLTLEKRKELKKKLNAQWRSIEDTKDQFILGYTDNKVSRLLKKKKTTIKGEFGEIFLTNKFGALVASTSKLSTFIHDHKYWWQGSYNNGNGAIFIDDRGYDHSIDGYALGLVIPIKKDDQITGILKFNLNIMHSVKELISNIIYDPHAEIKLVRSGGLIVFEEGGEPLTIHVHETILQKLKRRETKSFIIDDSGEKYVIGLSEIELTKKDGEEYIFGGTFESIDHTKGNTGESWYVIHYRSMSSILSPVVNSIKWIFFIGGILIFFLGLVSFWFSKKITKPIDLLNLATRQIGMGNFEYQIPEQQNDEFGELALSFNTMANHLKENTITINTLKNEVNQRKIVEKELKDSESRYRQLFDTNAAIKLIINPNNGAIIEANKAACEFYGYSKHKFKSLKISDINVLSQDVIAEEMAKAESEKKLFFNFSHKLASGEIRDVEVYSGPVKYGEKTYLHSIIHDITQRKQAEEALIENEKLLRKIAENYPHSYISIVEKDYTIGFTTGQEFKTKNLDPTQFIGRKMDQIFLDKTHLVKKYYNKTFNGEECTFELFINNEYQLYRTIPLHSEDNIISRILVVVENITEKKKLEQQIQQSQKMESIGTLAGGIAHDFNNILSSIIGFTELALDGVEKRSELEDDLQEVRIAGMRAKKLVKQILTFARQSDESVKPIQVSVIAKEVLNFIQSSIPSTIKINKKFNSDSFIIGSQTQIHQIMMNLCTNAAQAMEEKGGTLEVCLSDKTIDNLAITDLKPGEYIEIKVIDTGMGISSQHIQNIFEPYFTTKPVDGGTGMGLAVVHGIVESYAGKIIVDSTIGRGTTFTLYLPITKKRKIYTDSKNVDLPRGNENILFVDDEAPIAKMGRKILEQMGYTVSTKTSSIEALELFRAKPHSFDLVVTDMTMPNMTGDELVLELIKIRSDIPVVLCTGYSKKTTEKSALEIGIKSFINKPMDKKELVQTVRSILDKTKSDAQV